MTSAAAHSLSLLDRLQALSARERIFVAAGALALLLFLAWALSGGGDSAPAAPPAAFLSAPPPAPEIVPAEPLSVPAAPPADVSKLVLTGIMGSGAVFTFADGGQRAIPLGREFMPGLTLKQLGLTHVILGAAGGDLRLELNRFGATPAAPSPAAGAASPAAAVSPAESDLHGQTVDYRLGLQPVMAGGRIAGHRIKPGAALPALQRAGLRPGDTIVAVNGSSFDEERLMELSWELANSSRTELEYVRDGRRMKARITGK